MSRSFQGLGLSGGALGTTNSSSSLPFPPGPPTGVPSYNCSSAAGSAPRTGSEGQAVRTGTGSFQTGSRGTARAVPFAEINTYLSFCGNDPGCSSIPRKAFCLTINKTPVPSAPSLLALRLLSFGGGGGVGGSGRAEQAVRVLNQSSTLSLRGIPGHSCSHAHLILLFSRPPHWKIPPPPLAPYPQSSPELLLQTPNQAVWQGDGRL